MEPEEDDIFFEVSEEEYEMIEQAAASLNLTVNEFVVLAVMERVRELVGTLEIRGLTIG